MSILKPDNITTCNGVTVNEYLLTKHNPNKISMPSVSMNNVIGVTVHNTDWINTASNTTPAEQYTRSTVNGNMKSVRVHYYVDNVCAWQNLPLTLSGWHAADDTGNGNMKTIAIECIMSSAYNDKDKKSEDNCARLAAFLLHKYNLNINHLYTHTHWLNVRDGKKGTVDQLNVMNHPYKMCPAYILPHWQTFKNKVQKYLSALSGTKTESINNTNNNSTNNINSSGTLYRVQIGAFKEKTNADKLMANLKSLGYDCIIVFTNNLYKVQIGAYSIKTNADKMVKELKSKGFDAIIVSNTSSNISIKIGDKVKVKSGSTSYEGKSLASFVYTSTYTVISINNNRAVIGVNNVVTTSININNLIKL